LDEATNAVDQETENDLINIFRELPKSMTIIVISHRASTIAFCDDAIVLARGVVLESGPLTSTLAFRTMQAGAKQSASIESTPVQIPTTMGNVR
jgi:ABC-type bacteriocin/lantibiotic exporter with double-glycine peptidase domain